MWAVLCSVLAVGVLTYVLLVLFSGRSTEQGTHIDDFIIEATGDALPAASAPARSGPADLQTGPGRQVLVLYGTEYGFSEEVGVAVRARLLQETYQPRMLNARDFARVKWGQEQVLLCVFSTSGDGVPPTEARAFMDHLSKQRSGFSHLYFSVLALGDSNYPHFCRCGRTLHSKLTELGAKCIADRADIDQEDWPAIQDWIRGVVSGLEGVELQSRLDYLSPSSGAEETGFSRTRPFIATLSVKYPLTVMETEVDKETIHAEFDVSGSGLSYCPGDALGIYPSNNPPEVETLLLAMGCEGEEAVEPARSCHQRSEPCSSLRDVLMYCYDLKVVRGELVRDVVQSVTDEQQRRVGQRLLSNGLSKENKLLMEYLDCHEVIDVLTDFKSHTLPYTSLLSHMKSLQPRYYSIASAPAVNHDRIAVCAAVLRYKLAGTHRTGVATTFLQDRLNVEATCPVFISHNPDFRLPGHDLPIIMIGPGTGIAPFRAFLQERVTFDHIGSAVLTKATGENILYFGCRHCHKDFLYKDELLSMYTPSEQWEREGVLQLRVAFSRDQRHKVYVQHLIVEDSQRLWSLLQGGAHVYVCGDARAMASDVHKALLQVVQSQAQCDREKASDYLHQLEEQHCYQKDVWVT